MKVAFTHKRILVIMAIILMAALAVLYAHHTVIKSIDQFYFHDHAGARNSN